MRTFKIVLIFLILSAYLIFSGLAILTIPSQYQQGQQRRVNKFRPDLKYILDLSNQTDKPQPLLLMRYVTYYKLIQQTYGYDSAIKELLAFCLFYQGHTEQAIKLYQDALTMNSHLFYSTYNLGIIYLQQKKFNSAKDLFQHALTISTDSTMEHLYTSKGFSQIILSNKITPEKILSSLQETQKQTSAYIRLLNNVSSNQDELTGIIEQSHLLLF